MFFLSSPMAMSNSILMIKSLVARVGELLWVLRADQVYWTVCVRCLVTGTTTVSVAT